MSVAAQFTQRNNLKEGKNSTFNNGSSTIFYNQSSSQEFILIFSALGYGNKDPNTTLGDFSPMNPCGLSTFFNMVLLFSSLGTLPRVAAILE